jgi:hypothetical protein
MSSVPGMPSAAAPRRFWENTAARLARRVNFAAWLDRFAPAAFAAGSAAAVALYALRRSGRPELWGGAALAGALAVAAFAAWRRSRGSFFSPADARVLLEFQLGLDAGLSAATAGVTAWPRPAPLPRVLRWHAPDTLGWLAGTLALVAASLWLPVPGADEFGGQPMEPPPALAATEALLREAAKLTTVDPVSVAALAQRAQELAQKSPAAQYTHSSLEAADALQAQTATALQDLARNFDQAAAAFAPMAEPGATLSDAQRAALGDQLSSALRGLHEGGLSANQALLSQLGAAASAAGLGQLSAAQAAQLAGQMGAAGQGVKGILGAAGAGVHIAGPGPRSFPGFGYGGLFGGALTFGDQPSQAGDGKARALSGGDLARASLGDKLETTSGAHDVDPTKAVGPMSAGAVAGPAAGGEAVWVDRLTPAERTALKDFFK